MRFASPLRLASRLPSQALRASSPAGRAKCTPVDRVKLCGKANLKRLLLLYRHSKRSRFQLIPPEGGMSRSDRGDTLKGWRTAQLRRCLRQKQPKRSRGSGLLFASPQRRAQQKQGTATMPPPAAERAKNAPSVRGQQKSARLCGRFEMFALYRMFVPVSLQARKGRRALYSLRRATTGSFLAALREGIRPEIKVSRTLMPTRITAAGRGSTA